MSFSGKIKEELARTRPGTLHCQIAELQAILTTCAGTVISTGGAFTMKVHTENELVARRLEMLYGKAFGIRPEIGIRVGTVNCLYTLGISSGEQTGRVLRGIRLWQDDGEITEIMDEEKDPVLLRDCCRKAYLRGAFLATGSVSDPQKNYHLEITCPSQEKALKLKRIAEGFDLTPRVVERKGRYVFYLKEGDQIADMLGIMGASVSMMEMENIRILRDISNNVNRRVNCDAANIGKTVKASLRQIEDIRFLSEHMDMTLLPAPLAEMARVRLENPQMPLQELGGLLDPPLGKSGVNHRLGKLCSMAGDLREKLDKDNEEDKDTEDIDTKV